MKAEVKQGIFTLLIIILTAGITYYFSTKSFKKEKRNDRNIEALTALIEHARSYSNYSTVDWNRLDTLFYRPNNCDWEVNDNIDADYVDSIVFGKDTLAYPSSLACHHYHLLQNAKRDVMIKGDKARMIASAEVASAIKGFENNFDLAFQKMIEQNYYSRVFPEVYNEVMENAFLELDASVQEEFTK